MKVSTSWLKEYISFDMSDVDLANALTMVGLEVESIEDRFQYLESVVAVKVIDKKPHPQSDRLFCCIVSDHTRSYEVVCGAVNVQKGMVSALALPGTDLPGVGIVKKCEIRSEVSEGMLLSEAEMGTGMDSSGILDLDPMLSPGTSMKKVLGLSDYILEIGLTPNRPDCLGIIGIAREAAAICGKKLVYPDVKVPEEDRDIHALLEVQIDTPGRYRYSARLIEGVSVFQSPFWLRDRLLSVGIRPVNVVVDVTNYVMMETGQPLHAFDYGKIRGQKIFVRNGKEQEILTTLDNRERKLDADMVVISDCEKGLAIGGIMGGLDSEISGETTAVLLESAYFHPTAIRKSAKKLGIGTEASYRFERGVDPSGQIYALERAAQLLCDLCGVKALKGAVDISHVHDAPQSIRIHPSKVNDLLGTCLTKDRMAYLLESISFRVKRLENDLLQVEVPSFRVDILRPVDIAEEIARLSGYDAIPVTFPDMPPDLMVEAPILSHRSKVRSILSGFGFSEAVNYSFVGKSTPEKMGFPSDDPRRDGIVLLNPLSEDLMVMRTSLLPGLFDTACRNLSQQAKQLKIFETGRIFLKSGEISPCMEVEMLSGLWAGDEIYHGFPSKKKEVDFFQMKGVVEGVFDGLGIKNISFTGCPHELLVCTKPGHTARVFKSGENLGIVGEVSERVRREYGLKQPVFIFELDFDRISRLIEPYSIYQPLAKYPSTTRDMTLIVDNAIESQSIVDFINSINDPLIENAYLFDVFEKKGDHGKKKSLSFRVVYRSSEGTLLDEEVNRIHRRVTSGIVENYHAGLPSSE